MKYFREIINWTEQKTVCLRAANIVKSAFLQQSMRDCATTENRSINSFQIILVCLVCCMLIHSINPLATLSESKWIFFQSMSTYVFLKLSSFTAFCTLSLTLKYKVVFLSAMSWQQVSFHTSPLFSIHITAKNAWRQVL